MRSYYKFWTVLLLASSISQVSSTEKFSGEMRLDSMINRSISGKDLSSADLTDRLNLSRMRLRYDKQADKRSKWTGRIEFELLETAPGLFKKSVIDQSVNIGKTRISEANISYKMHRSEFRAGLVRAPDLTPEFERFSLGIGQQIGSILGEGSSELGMLLSFAEGPFTGVVGAWQVRPSLGAKGYRAINDFYALSQTITPSLLEGAISPQVNLDGSQILLSLPSTSFDSSQIPYAIGGRGSYFLQFQKNRSLGASVGASYQLLPAPIVLGVLYDPYVAGVAVDGATPAVPAEGYYRVLSFNDLYQFSVDYLRTSDQMRMSGAFSMQVAALDKSAGVLTQDITGGAATAPADTTYIFEDDGKSFAYFMEAGLLMKGDGYKVDRAKNVVKGIHLGKNSFGWEVGFRMGLERTTNLLSLLNSVGVNDFVSSEYSDTSGQGRYQFNGVQANATGSYTLVTVDNTTSASPYVTPLPETKGSWMGLLGTVDVTESYSTLTRGWAMYLNFYPQENTVLKCQFEYQWHEKRIYTRDNDYVNSINYQRDRNIQLRLESYF